MRTRIAAVAVSGIVALAACQTALPFGSMPALIGHAGTARQGGRVQSGQLPRKFEKLFVGTIGTNLRVRMDLFSDDGKLYGEYFYERIGTSIAVDGEISAKGDFTLSERNNDGTPTANFKGVAALHSVRGKPQVVLSGTWSSVATGGAQAKSFPFSISEEVFDLGPGLDLSSKTLNQSYKKPSYAVDLDYPQITGSNPAAAAFDRQVEALVQKKLAEFKKQVAGAGGDDSGDQTGSSFSVGYTIEAATPDLISVQLGVGEFYSGAAHPNGYSVTINYDLKSGKEIALKDLFTAGSPYLQTISKICMAKLKNKLGSDSDAQWILGGAGPKAENYKSWNVTTTGLEITFDAYQVAAYAFGSQEVFIQYSDLKSIIKTDGPLAAFLR
ncbi:MAG TPA: DUF3298 domain-containing protein [Blastocatellia bacterium]